MRVTVSRSVFRISLAASAVAGAVGVVVPDVSVLSYQLRRRRKLLSWLAGSTGLLGGQATGADGRGAKAGQLVTAFLNAMTRSLTLTG